jgi:hypothetical protein
MSNVTVYTIPLLAGDRVCVVHEGKPVRGFVQADELPGVPVMVTPTKDAEPVAYDRSEVYPLYRKVMTEEHGMVSLPLCTLPNVSE